MRNVIVSIGSFFGFSRPVQRQKMSDPSPIIAFPTLDPVDREALAWVIRLTSGDATEADADDLQRWRAVDPRHERAFRSATQLWQNSGPGLADTAPRRRWGRRAVMTAGMAAATAVAAQQAGMLPSFGRLLADHRTGVGERQTLHLPDGSRIEMNTATALSVRLTPDRRDIDLIEGEALFSVAPDRSRPFTVKAGTGYTRALGTEFCVRRDGAGARVTCLKGEIEVTAGDSVRLGAGQQVRYGQTVEPVVAADPDRAVAWMRGLLVFHDERLEAVLEEVNRYRSGWIVLTDPLRREQRVSGVFHLDRTEELLRHIRATFGLKETRIPGGVTLLS